MEILSTIMKLSPELITQHPLAHDAVNHPYAIPTAVVGFVILLFITFRPSKKIEIPDDTHAFIKFAQQRPPQVLADLVPGSSNGPSNEELLAQVARLSAQVAAIQQEMTAWFARRAGVEEDLVDATNKIFRYITDENRSIASDEGAYSNFRSPPPFLNSLSALAQAAPVSQPSAPVASPKASPKASPVQPLHQTPSLPVNPVRPVQPVQPVQPVNAFNAQQVPLLSRPPLAAQPPTQQLQPPHGQQQQQAPQWKPAVAGPSVVAPPGLAAVTPQTSQPPTQPPSPKGQAVSADAPALDLRPPQWRPSVPAVRPVPPGAGGFLRMPPTAPGQASAPQAPTPEAPPAPKARLRPQAKAIVASADPFASRA